MDSVRKAIWGDGTQPNESTGQEPISGQQGNTAAGEPYDAGNLSGTGENPSASQQSSILPGSATHPSNTIQGDPTKDLSTASSNQLESSRDRENLHDVPSGSAQRLSSQDTPDPVAPSHQGIDLNREGGGVTSSSSAGGIHESAGGIQGTDHRTSAPTPHAVSSAGAGNVERATENAGGIQGSKSGSGSGSGGTQAADAGQGPPAQELHFSKKEIDEAANVTTSHENPHTIGTDGKEQKLDDCGGVKDDKASHQAGAHEGKGNGSGSAQKVSKMEKLKEKLHIGSK